jgi:hypothetical protein
MDCAKRQRNCRQQPGRLVGCLLLGVALFALSACGEAARNTAVPATPSPSVAPPTPLVIASPLPFAFPQQQPTPRNQAMMAALLQGTLILRDGCLRVIVAGNDHLILWPAEAVVLADGATFRIVAGDGRTIARVGEPIMLGGGELPSRRDLATQERARLRATPPADCPGPFWLANFTEPRYFPTVVTPRSR